MPEVLELEVVEVNEFTPILKQSGIAKAETYASLFAPFMITVKELSDKAASINKENPSALDAKLAREVRLAMVKNRTATANKKDESKAALLAESNLIQNLHNVVINTSQLIEAELSAVEKHAEIKEAARVAALKAERMELLAPYVEDANIFPLGSMSEEQFTTMLEGYKLAHQQKIEAEQKAEAERLAKEAAEKLEQERIRQENERLKAEAAIKEKRNAELRPFIMFIRDYSKMIQLEESEYQKEFGEVKKGAEDHWEFERKEQIRKQAEAEQQAELIKKQQAEAERIAKENAEKLAAIEAANKAAREKAAAEQAERERLAKIEADKVKAENDRLAAELKAKQEAERVAAEKLEAERKAKITAEKKAAKAPDKDKLKAAVESLPVLLVEVKTEEAQRVADNIREKFIAFKKWANEQIESL